MLKSVLLSLFLVTIAQPAEYEITIQGPITIRVKVIDPVPPVPDPPPAPDPPTPDPLPAIVAVGPGQAYTELGQVDWARLPEGATVKILHRETPYVGKISITVGGVTVEGVPGPHGERPILSGNGAVNRADEIFPTGLQGASIVCIGHRTIDPSKPVTIRGLEIRDCQEMDTMTDSTGAVRTYGGGAASVYVANGTVRIENCKIAEAINGVFSKCIYGRVNLTMTDCEITACGDDDGIADESAYFENIETHLVRCTFHNHRNPGTTGIHSRDNRFVAEDCHIESGGLCWLGNSCDGDSIILVDGKMPDGVAEFTRCKLVSMSQSEVASLRTATNFNVAKEKATFAECVLVKKYSTWKSLWCTAGDGSTAAKIAYDKTTFVSIAPNETGPPTPMFFSVGRNETITIKGCKAILQAPQETLFGILSKPAGTTFIPADWQSEIRTEGKLSYQETSKRLDALLAM